MQVLAGPPGSGKTSYVLDQVRASLRQRNSLTVVVPTTTMAEHFRNQLAREGFVFRPSTIVTFSKFVDSLVPDLPPVSGAALELIIGDSLQTLPLLSFAAVKGYTGFRRSVVDQIDELTAAGITSRMLRKTAARIPGLDEFLLVYASVEAEVAKRGWYFRSQRLVQAAARLTARADTRIILHGFFSFTRPELELIAALGRSVELLVTLPSWKGAEDSLKALKTLGAENIHHPIGTAAELTRILTTAPTADQEAEEIARRILKETDAGREFREIGVVVRSENPSVPVLRCAFERFGIPARFYFGTPLKDCSAIAFLRGVVDAMLSEWEHEQTIHALRKSGSPISLDVTADEFEFRVRRELPNRGLAALRQIAGRKYENLFGQLELMDGWRTSPATASQWTGRFRQLTALFAPPGIVDGARQRDIEVWREQSAALGAFEAAVDELATVLDPHEPLECVDYWASLQTVIDANTLRVPDHRRNVVHVIDAYEARQWKLPVIFLCGLLEKQFPKHHSESPLLPDAARIQIRESGVHLRTNAERHEEEQFLFELATSRATSKLVLSYPLLNGKGEANMTSFFLERMRERSALQEEKAVRCRPRPAHAARRTPLPAISDEGLRAVLKARHVSFTPTAIETFLQCPYQFFAEKTLKLEEAPPDPSDRLNALVQGTIAHDALHLMYRDGITLAQAFDSAWADRCARARVLPGYRNEAVRLELFRNLQRFVNSVPLPASSGSEYESKITMQLPDGTEIKGRMDRIDVDAQGRVLVIDYKYKRETGIRQLVKAHDNGTLVQGGLYVLALRAAGLQPAGMVYAGFRREASFGGWIVDGAFSDLEQACSTEELNDLVRRAVEVSVRSVNEIHDGRIAPAPADEAKCDHCAYASACRVEVAAPRTITTRVGE